MVRRFKNFFFGASGAETWYVALDTPELLSVFKLTMLRQDQIWENARDIGFHGNSCILKLA